MGGDEGLLRDLAGFYLEDAPPLLDQFEEAIEHHDVGEAIRSAHTIKALSANFDAHALCALAHDAEHAARRGDLDAAGQLVPELHAGIESVMDRLQVEFPGLAAADRRGASVTGNIH
jgi:HPt (histidine-containing phosphotransfer) domain-containing protein